jgi:HEAT repeat protein
MSSGVLLTEENNVKSVRRVLWRTWPWSCATLLLVIGFIFAATDKDATTKKDDGIESVTKRLESPDHATQERAVAALLKQRKAVIELLIPMIPADKGKRSDDNRAAAIYVLGELRAVEAVPALSKVLGEEIGPSYSSIINRRLNPVFGALVKIGRPAVPAMIEIVEKSDDPIARGKSLEVLYHVLGGKAHVLELLDKLKASVKEAKLNKRIVSAIKYTKEQFTGEDPLY